jgi:hypothetical protein
MHTPTLFTLGLMLTLLGCSTPPPAPVPAPHAPAPASLAKPTPSVPAWVRQDRYTLASTRPTLEQRQPLYQLINVQIAPVLHATVGEALRHVLQHSGYSLCPDNPGAVVPPPFAGRASRPRADLAAGCLDHHRRPRLAARH